MNCKFEPFREGKIRCIRCSRVVCSTNLTLKAGCRASRGLGDTLAKITTAIGIPPCGGCAERQEKLNKLVPYKD